MKKILFALLLLPLIGLSQTKPKKTISANIVKHKMFTTVERDLYVVPSTDVWIGYNTTTQRFQVNKNGNGWEDLTTALIVNPTGNLSSTDLQSALEELQGDIDNLSAGNSDGFLNGITESSGILTFSVLGQTDQTYNLSSFLAAQNYSSGTHTIDGLGPDGDVGDIIIGGGGTTATIQNGAVSSLKIGTNSVTSDAINNLAVTTGHLANDAVTPGKIAEGANGEVLTTDGNGDVVWAASGGGVTADQTTILNSRRGHFYIELTASRPLTLDDQSPITGTNAGRRAIPYYDGVGTIQIDLASQEAGPHENYYLENKGTGTIEIVENSVVTATIASGHSASIFETTENVWEITIASLSEDNNFGIVAEGTVTTVDTSDFIVAHGLGYVPALSRIQTQVTNTGASASVTIKGVTSTDFTIATNNANPITISWRIFGTGTIVGQTASEVGYDNLNSGLTATNVQGAIDEVVANSGGTAQKQYDDMAALLAYSGSYVDDEVVYLNGTQSGNFQYDASDTTSADNGGTIFVDAAGNRLKRLVSSIGESRWFFPDPLAADNTANVNKWIEVMADSDFVSWNGDGYYQVTQAIDIAGTNGTDGYEVIWGEGKGLWSDTADTNVIDTRNKTATNIKWRGGKIWQTTTTPVANSSDKTAIFFAGGDFSGLEITGVNIRTDQAFNGIKLYSEGIGEMQSNILLKKNIFDVGRMGIETVNHAATEAVRFTNLDILENTFNEVGKIEQSIPISLSGKGNDAFIQNNYAENFTGMFIETAGYDYVTIDSNTFFAPNGHLLSATSVWGSSHVTVKNNKSIGISQGSLVKLGNDFTFKDNKLNAPITIQDSKNVSFSGDTFRGSIFGSVIFNGVNDSISFRDVNLMGYVDNSPAIIINADTNTNVVFEGGLIKTEGTLVHNANGSTFSPTFQCVDFLDNGVSSVLGCNNFDLATQAEAEAGTATDKLMTPERTAQSIAALSTSSFLVDNGGGNYSLDGNLSIGNTNGGNDLDLRDATGTGMVINGRVFTPWTNGTPNTAADFNGDLYISQKFTINSTNWIENASWIAGGLNIRARGTSESVTILDSDDIEFKIGQGTITYDGNTVPRLVAVPATATSTGVVGQIAFDLTHVYRCTATDTWVRAPLTFATW